MAQVTADSNPASPRDRAKTLILKTLGVGKVAAWCGVGEMAVYQWLQRGTDEKPIPAERVPTIVRAARAEGHAIEAGDLWPEMAGLS